mgnify:CR=1 FL=1
MHGLQPFFPGVGNHVFHHQPAKAVTFQMRAH